LIKEIRKTLFDKRSGVNQQELKIENNFSIDKK